MYQEIFEWLSMPNGWFVVDIVTEHAQRFNQNVNNCKKNIQIAYATRRYKMAFGSFSQLTLMVCVQKML